MRAIPDDNLAFPVLITLDTGVQGSGFFFNTENNTYLITAKHVFIENGKLLGRVATILAYPVELHSAGKIVIEIDMAAVEKSKDFKVHNTHDIVAIKIINRIKEKGQLMAYFREGVILKQKAGTGIVAAHIGAITLFKNVLVSNQIILFGYPSSLGIKNIPQIDYDIPLLRSGIIAGVNQQMGTIIIDCPVYPGNSGGPVLQVESEGVGIRKFSIIGVVSQYVPFAQLDPASKVTLSNSGYSIVVPIDKVLELL